MNRIVFMGTPEFAVPVLEALVETQSVVGVVTQPDRPAGRGQRLRPSPVKEAARNADLPLYQPNSLKTEDAAAPLRSWAPDAIVVAAFGQILRPHVLNLPPLGCLNVHASLLPRWRGASPIQHALLAGDTQTGISLMRMEVGLDTGPVYVQRSIPIRSDDTAASLHDRLADLGAAMIRGFLDAILAGQLEPLPQNETAATYAPMIRKEDGQLNWKEPASALSRRVRAMAPWPGAWTSWRGQPLKILGARVTDEQLPAAAAGTVLFAGDEVAVRAGEGGLTLTSVQLAGRKTTSIEAFLRGQPDFVGSVLGQEGTT